MSQFATGSKFVIVGNLPDTTVLSVRNLHGQHVCGVDEIYTSSDLS